MRTRRTGRAWPRAFTHPLWWSALGTLLINDHVLKGARVLPPLLTGKLSDLAGMIVAPAVLALALDADRRAHRAFACTAVGAGLAWLKLSPAAAQFAGEALARLGLNARIWPDPSDLIALPLLGVGYVMCRPATRAAYARRAIVPRPGPFGRSRAAFVARHAGLLAAIFACVATSGFGGSKKSARNDAPSVKNSTSADLTLVIASTEGAGGCTLYRDDRASILTPNAFGHPRTVTLKAGSQAALPVDLATTPCGAASISLPDGEAIFLLWRDLDEIASFVPDDDKRRLARLAIVSGKSSDYKIALGDDLTEFKPGGDPPAATCKDEVVASTLEVTGLASTQGFLKLGEQRTADDGCLEIDWFSGEGDSSPDTQRLCIPDWAFPFTPDEWLSVTEDTSAPGHSLRIARYSKGSLALELVIWNDVATFPSGLISELKPVDCVGSITDCGAYLRPAQAHVRGKDSALEPGAETTIKKDKPKTIRLLLGAVHEVSWSAPSCSGTEASPGLRASALELRTY